MDAKKDKATRRIMLLRIIQITLSSFLSIAIATGSLVSKESTGASFPLQPKEGFAVLAWALLAALIQARLVAGWRGRRVALLVVAGFLLLVGTYAGLFAAPPQASTLSMLVPGGG